MEAQHRLEPMAQVAEQFVFFLRKQSDGSRWPVGTNLYADVDVNAILHELLKATQEMVRTEMSPPDHPKRQAAYAAARAAINNATSQ